ncbi:MAG: ribosomal-processing cysteine protease Prp [Synergistaceae bacterium]|jgi:uncharacterized protein YsxB (DUF464 family)|nr:ribosomal-processing cysteine protease Prp [Synergistaceae bacterium]
MLEVTARRGASGIFSITAEGHTGFSDAGTDIVCAAVSVLMQALLVGLEDVLELEGVASFSDPEIPLVTVEWDEDSLPARQLAATILLSLAGVADTYPDFVRVTEVIEEDDDDDDD